MQKYLLLAGFLGVIAFVIYGYQDVCPRLSPSERLEVSDAVFTGLVESVNDDLDTAKVTLLSVWKGELPEQITMRAKYLKAGYRYLIYAYTHNNDWFTSNCGGYVLFTEAGEAIGELGEPTAIKAVIQ